MPTRAQPALLLRAPGGVQMLRDGGWSSGFSATRSTTRRRRSSIPGPSRALHRRRDRGERRGGGSLRRGAASRPARASRETGPRDHGEISRGARLRGRGAQADDITLLLVPAPRLRRGPDRSARKAAPRRLVCPLARACPRSILSNSYAAARRTGDGSSRERGPHGRGPCPMPPCRPSSSSEERPASAKSPSIPASPWRRPRAARHCRALLDPATGHGRLFGPADDPNGLVAEFAALAPDPPGSWARSPLASAPVDVVLNLLHGRRGRGGAVATVLAAGHPVTGSGPAASAAAMDKVLAKRVFRAEGIPVARELLWGGARAPASRPGRARPAGVPRRVRSTRTCRRQPPRRSRFATLADTRSSSSRSPGARRSA